MIVTMFAVILELLSVAKPSIDDNLFLSIDFFEAGATFIGSRPLLIVKILIAIWAVIELINPNVLNHWFLSIRKQIFWQINILEVWRN